MLLLLLLEVHGSYLLLQLCQLPLHGSLRPLQSGYLQESILFFLLSGSHVCSCLCLQLLQLVGVLLGSCNCPVIGQGHLVL